MTAVAMPERIAGLPLDPQRGVPVPWFVAWIDGKPDFRVIGTNKIGDAIRFQLCWICGKQRGRVGSFVIGPMCAVNRTSSEPPSHRDCAIYAAMVCPFLAKPHMRRREAGMPEEALGAAGQGIKRNPGVALVWSTRNWKWYRVPAAPGVNAGILCEIGDPEETLWFCEGREATRAEVDHSIETGLPLLRVEAEKEGPKAIAVFDAYVARAEKYLPPAVSP